MILEISEILLKFQQNLGNFLNNFIKFEIIPDIF